MNMKFNFCTKEKKNLTIYFIISIFLYMQTGKESWQEKYPLKQCQRNIEVLLPCVLVLWKSYKIFLLGYPSIKAYLQNHDMCTWAGNRFYEITRLSVWPQFQGRLWSRSPWVLLHDMHRTIKWAEAARMDFWSAGPNTQVQSPSITRWHD